MLISASFTGSAFAQAASAVITKSFNRGVVALNGSPIATITVTNPNAVLPLMNVQFSDTMPAGIDLITQTGGTCSTLATGEACAPSIRHSEMNTNNTITFNSLALSGLVFTHNQGLQNAVNSGE